MHWIKVSRTNRNPRVVAAYFLDFVRKGKVPKIIRVDHGSENVLIADIQTVLRDEHNDEWHDNCVIKGPSTSNQVAIYFCETVSI